ncbi:hypothetical protein LguiB_022662 [Lonicera macranthoides]
MAMLYISIFLSLPCALFSIPYSTFTSIQLPPGVTGPESVALDPLGGGPYVAVADGRVLKWLGPTIGFVDFATTSPNRTKQQCDGTTDPNLGFMCGRPLGFSFNSLTGQLYIADAYLGLHVVGPSGGLATRLATSAEGITFRFLDGVDVDQVTGNVYFSSASTTYDLRNISQPNFVPDSSGRLLRYNPGTKSVTVLLRGLNVAIGPAVSLDGSFVLVSEYTTKRVLRFWINGPNANTVEVFLNLPGNPSKVKRTILGDFWVAVNIINQQPTPSVFPQGIKFNAFKTVLQTMNFNAQYPSSISVVQETSTEALLLALKDKDLDIMAVEPRMKELIAGDLYIADPYYGLNVVRHDGGLATQLATTVEGVPFRFLIAVDVDPLSGYVYFTDASAIYEPR